MTQEQEWTTRAPHQREPSQQHQRSEYSSSSSSTGGRIHHQATAHGGRIRHQAHVREPSPESWLDDFFEDDHLEFLRDEFPDLSDDALENINYDRIVADAMEFGGYRSDSS